MRGRLRKELLLAAVDVTGRINPRSVARLGAQRRVSADNYKGGGESGRATTYTLTIVVTTTATAGGETLTADFAST